MIRPKRAVSVKRATEIMNELKADGLIIIKFDKIGVWPTSCAKTVAQRQALRELAELFGHMKAPNREAVERLFEVFMP